MSNDLVKQANAVKIAVDKGKEDYAATKREFEVNKRSFEETMAEVKTKYGVESYKDLKAEVEQYEAKIRSDLQAIKDLLLQANIQIE